MNAINTQLDLSRAPDEATVKDFSLGTILIRNGKLKPSDAETILRLQREQGMRFGEAAVALKLVTPEDIQHALSLQYEFPYLTTQDTSVSPDLVAAYHPFSKTVEGFRALRSQLSMRWFGKPEQAALAVVSAQAGDGRSFMAANLAIVFSQLGMRTLLIDADLRNPKQHAFFHLDNKTGLSSYLSGRNTNSLINRVPSFADLSVMPSGPLPPNPLELLSRPLFSEGISILSKEFDVILVDTPALDNNTLDALAVAKTCKGALLLAKNNQTKQNQLLSAAKKLASADITIVGSVINEFN